MKTKNIFKALALAILMPALLLNTACNSEIINNENTDGKGFALPVTVNVTRQGDDPATKATYNESTRKLAFSAGDKLLVRGNDNSGGGAGYFAGMLEWTSGETFSGTIYTQNKYSGTADELFTAATANWVGATLFPNGYESFEFLSISGSGYSTSYEMSYNKAIAATKAAAVVQFSLESAKTYSSGFALSPQNAILNFTITGLTDGEKAVTLKNGSKNMFTGSVTPTSGTAAFALGAMIDISSPAFFKNVILTIGGTDIAINSTNNYLEAGKIYNINRSASAPLPAVFTVDAGKTVKFSKSNLRYASGAWGFFAHQYDYYTTYSDDAWDKFGWSNSTNNYGMSTSTENAVYQGDLVDWGNVPGIGTGWFTLSNNEWVYLFNTRSASTVNSVDNARYAKGKVNGVYGIILFPDTYTHPTGVTLPVGINEVGNAGWNGNNYSAADWTAMETAGCVFLPATGYREGTSVQSAGSSCSYRSSTRLTSTTDMVNYVYFTATSLNVSASNYGRYGQCVRLVRVAN